MASPKKRLTLNKAVNIAPAPKKKSPAGIIITLLLLLGIGVGGHQYYTYQQEKAEQARLAAERAAKEKAEREAELRRRAEEAEAARRKKAEEAAAEAERKRREAEEAERKRREAEEAERKRREAEEAERRRREQEQPEPEPTPEPEPEKPQSIYDQPVSLIGSDCNVKENRELYDSMIAQMLEKGEFDLFAAAFAEKIKACVPEIVRGEKMSHNTYKNSKLLVQAIDLCLLIDMASAETMKQVAASTAAPGPKGESNDGKQFILWALNDKSQPLHNMLRGFALNEGKPENMGYAIKTFYTLWSQTPAKMREKYLNLALACSLVNPSLANSAGSVRNPKTPLLTMPQVYDYFREMDGKKKLITDVKKLSVSDLLYVVNVRLPRSEFDWVQENMSYPQARWGEAYASIRYIMSRAANNHDPYTHYTFAELRKEGGVCRDQGYFAHTTAKCKGIPAVYIVGDGDRGGHAWIAHLVNDITWQQTGSYGYNTGRFSNPCSGRQHHESLLLKRDKKTTDAKLAPAADGMIVSDYLSRIGCNAEARAAAKYVTSAFPTLTAAWGNRLKVVTADEEDMPDEDMWKELNRELSRAGRHNPELMDFAADIQSDHLMEGKSKGAQKQAMNRNLRRMQRDLDGERSDLLMEAVERQAAVLVENNDLRGLSTLYKKMLKDNTKRGDLFLNLLGAWMRHLEELEAPPRVWASLAKDADSIANKGVITNTGDHFKLTKEVAIQKMIAEAYKEAGNTRKAEKISEAADARLKASKEKYKPE